MFRPAVCGWGSAVSNRCLKCGAATERPFLTGMGMYGKCLGCGFRWTEQDEGRLMGYTVLTENEVGLSLFWKDVPDGCLLVF